MVHELKTVQPYFDDVANGNKSFEVRKADRPYSVGDILALNEYVDGAYTGRFLMARIVYILKDISFVKDGYWILGMLPVELCGRESIYTHELMPNRITRAYPVYGEKEGTNA